MDPNANVAERTHICLRIAEGNEQPGDTARLHELEFAYREWVTAGGFRAKPALIAGLVRADKRMRERTA